MTPSAPPTRNDVELVDTAQLPLPRAWVPQALASLGDGGAELRLPLSVFFCASIRREIERQLEATDLHPQWELARKTVDEGGRSIRLVPVLRVDELPS